MSPHGVSKPSGIRSTSSAMHAISAHRRMCARSGAESAKQMFSLIVPPSS
jgi:hypothetical protein